MRNIAIAAVVVCFVLFESSPGFSEQDQKYDVSIEATPRMSFVINNRAYIRVIIRIKQHPDNRNLVFEWESPDGESGRKDRQLDGEESPSIFDTSDERFFGRQGLQLPEGHYTLTVIVEKAIGSNPRADTKITIGGLDDDTDR